MVQLSFFAIQVHLCWDTKGLQAVLLKEWLQAVTVQYCSHGQHFSFGGRGVDLLCIISVS